MTIETDLIGRSGKDKLENEFEFLIKTYDMSISQIFIKELVVDHKKKRESS